jgi:hypothetical protein
MKRVAFSKSLFKYFSFILLLAFSILPGISVGQMDSMPGMHDMKETDMEVKTTVSPSVDFTSLQKSDNTVDLKAIFKAKINGNLIKLSGLMIRFFSTADSVDKELGGAMTDRSGSAVFNCKADALTPDKEGKLHFKVSFTGNKSIVAVEEVVTVKRAKLVMVPVKVDSVLSVQLKLIDLSTGNETAIAETDLNVFVKRLFNPLKLGTGKTDSSGETSIDIPNNLPGDAKGNITLLARLDDNEQYGNLEASVMQPWGTPVSDEIKELPRALWSSHPPMWMVVTFIVLMTAVWGHYIVILYELFRLRKEHV